MDKEKKIKKTVKLSEKNKAIMVRQSGHFTEQILISNKDACALLDENKNTFNRELFRDFNEKNNAEILKEFFVIEDIGYKLSPPENRLVTAIRSELFNKSENMDTKSEKFYMGNYFPKGEIIKTNFGGQIMSVPHLLIPHSDLYKAFLGKDNYSGEEQKNIDKLLFSFSKKYFLTIYKQHVLIKGETRVNRITEYLPLIRVKQLDKGLSTLEDNLLDQNVVHKKRESNYLISINPIWVDQIKTKWVEFPYNLNARINEVVGHWNKVTPATNTLMNYLFHLRSTKNFITEINEDNLLAKLGLDKYIKRRKRKIAESYLLSAIQVCKKIGLCKKANKLIGAKGQSKWEFEVNKKI